MSSGKIHDQAILLATPVLGLAVCGSAGFPIALAATTGYVFGGFYLSPDLDTKSRPWRRWGPLRMLWEPYRRLVPHRSFLSHSPIVGSAIRLLYLAILLALATAVWGVIVGSSAPVTEIMKAIAGVPLPHAIFFIIGVELSSLTHLILDGF